ncbi:hypothetical protein ABPG75_007885 [Micractinium tetrahymenae]
MAAAKAGAAPPPLPPMSSEDLSSLLPGHSFTARVVDAFFSAVLPAALQAEGAGGNLQRCLVPPPGLLGALWATLLQAPATDAGSLECQELSRWWQAHSPFSRQFLLLPLVDSQHASLLIVCQLGGRHGGGAAEGPGGPAGNASSGGSCGPCILHLDSLHSKGGSHQPNFGLLRQLLQAAAQQHGVAPQLELTDATLPAVTASVPQQRSSDGSGASYMCTNALYFVASLPPVIDAKAVAQLAEYRVHLRDLFEGTPHCYPGFLTRDWYPGNVPESLRKRVLQGMIGLIKEQALEPVQQARLLDRAQEVMAQLRAKSKRPFDMPEKRRQKQQQEKEERRLKAGLGAQSGEPAAAGMAGAAAAGAAASRAAAAPAAAAAPEGGTGASGPAGPGGVDQHGRVGRRLRPHTDRTRRSLLLDKSDVEEGQPASSSTSPAARTDEGSDYVPSQDSEDSSDARQQQQTAGGPTAGSTKRRATGRVPGGSPVAKRQQGSGQGLPEQVHAAGATFESAALAEQQGEAALAALVPQQVLLPDRQHQAGGAAPSMGSLDRPADPGHAGAAEAVVARQGQQHQPLLPPLAPSRQQLVPPPLQQPHQHQVVQQPGSSPLQEQPGERQHASQAVHKPVQPPPVVSGDQQASVQRVLASMAAAEGADELRRPYQQRVAVRDALQLLRSTPRWKACLKRFGALPMEEQDVKFVALHEQLQDAEDAAEAVERWVREQLG